MTVRILPQNINILTVTTYDIDLPSTRNGQRNYSLINAENKFVIDNLGRIKTNGLFDVESKSFYTFIVETMDQGNPTKTARATVNVIVTDYNDNRPVVSVNNFTVFENDTGVIGAMSASDSDILPDNKNFAYSIKPEGVLAVDLITPVCGSTAKTPSGLIE